jgi:CRISPR system Cascade subunit CasA
VNVLLDEWIPVYLKDGSKTIISPHEIASGLDSNPAIRVAFNRPDLDATMLEFLIGVLQTFFCPDERVPKHDWKYIFSNPPDSKTLHNAFEPISPYFNLLGDGIRFMQDRSVPNSANKEECYPGSLLIDFDANQAHFSKRRIETLCLKCTAGVLYTFHVRANTGGRGHMQNMRGGNAFTTLVKGETLWETCWLNVISKGTLERYRSRADREDIFVSNDNSFEANQEEKRLKAIFPWMMDSTEGLELEYEDISTLHGYWQMPRRVFIRDTAYGRCMLCHAEGACVTKVLSSPQGIKYIGRSRFHPLSPLVEKKGNHETIYYEFYGHKEYGTRYKHWLALTRTEPAPCVASAIRRNTANKLWAFGYVCKTKLALAWDEGEFPIISFGDELREADIANIIRRMIDVASGAAELLQKHASKAAALIAKAKKKRTKYLDRGAMAALFWEASEYEFYEYVRRLPDIFSGKVDVEGVLLGWFKKVQGCVIEVFDRLFDHRTEVSAFDFESTRIVAEHRLELIKGLNKLLKPRKEGKRG